MCLTNALVLTSYYGSRFNVHTMYFSYLSYIRVPNALHILGIRRILKMGEMLPIRQSSVVNQLSLYTANLLASLLQYVYCIYLVYPLCWNE